MTVAGDVTVISTLSIQNSANAAIIRAAEASGGFSTVTDHTARDALPSAVTTLGTLVRTLSDGIVWEVTSVGPVVWSAWSGAGGVTSVDGKTGAVASTVLTDTLFVDAGYSGSVTTGAIEAPYKTIPAAVAAAVSGGITSAIFRILPGTYTAAIAISGAVNYKFIEEGYAGTSLVKITGQVTWTITDNASVGWEGCVVKTGGGAGPIFKDDVAAGTGNASWSMHGGELGNQTNGNSGAAPFTHHVNVGLTGSSFGPTFNMPVGTINISGELATIYAELNGNITCLDIIADTSIFGTGITATVSNDSVLQNLEFGSGVTIAFTTSNRTLTVDDATNWGLPAVTITGTGYAVEIQRIGNRLSHTFHVDPGFVGTQHNGSVDNPYTTIVSAVAAAVSASVTDAVFMIQPGTYSGALAIAGAVRYKFIEVGFAGIPLVNVTGQVTWTITDGAEISWEGCVVRTGAGSGPIFKDDVAAGTGAAHWNVRGGWMGVQTNGNTAAAAFTHDVRLRGLYHIVNGESAVTTTQPTIDGFDTIGASPGFGQVQVTNCFMGGPGPYRCGFIRMRYSSFAASSTLNTASAGSTFEHGSSLGSASVLNNLGTAGIISLDVYSMYFWATNRNTQTGSANSIIPVSIDHTAELNASNGAGSSFALDLIVNTRQKLTLNSASCAISVTALKYPVQSSCDIELRFVQDATGGRAVTFSSDFVGTVPSLNTAANAETLISLRWNSTTQKFYFTGSSFVGTGVTSWNSRTAAVSPATNDYTDLQIQNTSSVTGTGVKGALNTLLGLIGGSVTSVFGRGPVVTAASGDYAASQVTNDSTVIGTGVSGAINTLKAQIAGLVASAISNDSSVTGTTVKDALNTLLGLIVSLTSSAPANVTKSAAAAGTATTSARADHKHDITTAAAVTTSTANAEGTATSLARSDHTHAVSLAGADITNDSVISGVGVKGALNTIDGRFAADEALIFTGEVSVQQVAVLPPGSGWNFNAAASFWADNTATGTTIWFSIGPIPPGVGITAVKIAIQPDSGHTLLPTTMPTLTVVSTDPGGGGVLGTVTDSSATVGAYETAHVLTVSFARLPCNTTSIWAALTSEGGSHVVSGTEVRAVSMVLS